MTRRTFLAATGAVALAVRLPASRVPEVSSVMSAQPVLVPDHPWEGACAMPFSGGIWKHGAAFRCYYLANFNRVCLALSDDGLTWHKPDVGIVAGTNILLEIEDMDSFSVVPHEGRWYMTVSKRGGGPLQLFTSANGIWWTLEATMPFAGDRTTLWWNPAKARWTFNVRMGGGIGGDPRRIDRVESETFIPKTWTPVPWLRADSRDGDIESGRAQLYALDVIPMGDRLVGLFTILRGLDANRPKLNDVCVGFSLDGDSWQRSYTPILTLGAHGSWHYGNVQSVTGGLLKIAGSYRLYASGRAGQPGTSGNGVCSMGYATVTL